MNVEKAQRAERERRRRLRGEAPAEMPDDAADPRWPHGCPSPYMEAAMTETEGSS